MEGTIAKLPMRIESADKRLPKDQYRSIGAREKGQLVGYMFVRDTNFQPESAARYAAFGQPTWCTHNRLEMSRKIYVYPTIARVLEAHLYGAVSLHRRNAMLRAYLSDNLYDIMTTWLLYVPFPSCSCPCKRCDKARRKGKVPSARND